MILVKRKKTIRKGKKNGTSQMMLPLKSDGPSRKKSEESLDSLTWLAELSLFLLGPSDYIDSIVGLCPFFSFSKNFCLCQFGSQFLVFDQLLLSCKIALEFSVQNAPNPYLSLT